MNILAITSAALAVGAAMDGKSTIDFLRKSNGALAEANPLLVWLYRTDTPSNNQVIFGGAAIIAAEVGVALLASHFWHPAAWLFAAQQGVQAGIHVYEYFRNEKTLAAYLASIKR
jgi:hypothetical protein